LLDPVDAVLLLVHTNGDRIDGRTVIQKLVYFTQLLVPLSRKFHFVPHFYGPYSSELAALLDSLVGLRFLRAEVTRTPRHRDMYSYRLTEDGLAVTSRLQDSGDAKKVLSVIEKCRSLTALNPDVLSYAAKANHILSQRRRAYTDAQVVAEGKKFGWHMTPDQVKRGVDVLLDLGLAKRKKAAN